MHHAAEPKDFERAAEPFLQAAKVLPGSQETGLALARLYRARAAWERTSGQDPRPSLFLGRSQVDHLRKSRPGWGEPLALLGGLILEEAETLPPGERGLKAREALQLFSEAFTQNKNLLEEWKPQADRLQKWAKAPAGTPTAPEPSRLTRSP